MRRTGRPLQPGEETYTEEQAQAIIQKIRAELQGSPAYEQRIKQTPLLFHFPSVTHVPSQEGGHVESAT